MARPAAKCGTDGGYYRHRRRKEPACDECKAAHSVATRRDRSLPTPPPKLCPCGNRMHRSRELCGPCTRKAEWVARTTATYGYAEDEADPKRPVAWRPNGKGIQVPVYEQSEVA